MRITTTSLTIILFALGLALQLNGQTISTPKGFTPHVGIVVSMLDDLKDRVDRRVRNLDQAGTDFLLDEESNRIGALILHLAATEKYYQVYTFENRGFNRSEAMWESALNLGAKARAEFVGKPISYYLDLWDEVRDESKRLLKTKDDDWFAQKVRGSRMNNHWAWYHVMEHQASHLAHIGTIIKKM